MKKNNQIKRSHQPLKMQIKIMEDDPTLQKPDQMTPAKAHKAKTIS